MYQRWRSIPIFLAVLLSSVLMGCGRLDLEAIAPFTPPVSSGSAAVETETASVYSYRTVHNPDGIGKFYLGREIAQVMGHQGAGWLERPSRQREEQPDRAIAALELKPTDIVADIGAGTGYFSFRLSPLVPQGKVYAVDVQPEMIEFLNYFKAEYSKTEHSKTKYNAANVEPVLGSETSPNLPPESVDWALMVDAYHEFEFPREMMEGIVSALKPGGRVVLLEYRGENPLIPIKGLHKMTQGQVRKEMQAVGLTWQTTESVLPQQHLMIFRKPEIPT